MANQTGFIIFDTTSESFVANSRNRAVVFGWKDGNQWKYDNNSGIPTDFTPDDEMVAMGWLETSTSDLIVSGGLFDPVPLELAATPGSTNDDLAGTKTQTFIQDAAPSAVTVGDLWIETDNNNKMWRASATGTGNWVAATPDPDTNTTTIIGGTVTTSYINALDVNAATVSAGWVYAGALTAGQIQTAGSAFRPTKSWVFRNTNNGFTVSQLTQTNHAYYIELDSTSFDPKWRTPSNLGLDGLRDRYIKIRMRRTAGSFWDGTVYWTGDTVGESGSYRKDFTIPPGASFPNQLPISEDWSVVLLDMWDLTAGGDAWKDDTDISQIRFDFGAYPTDTFEVDFVMVGDLSADTAGTYIDSGGIYTGNLTASQITTGSIQSSDTKTYFDLDSDKIVVNDGSNDRLVLGDISSTNDGSLYGMKLSYPTFDAISASNEELIFSSTFGIPKQNTIYADIPTIPYDDSNENVPTTFDGSDSYWFKHLQSSWSDAIVCPFIRVRSMKKMWLTSTGKHTGAAVYSLRIEAWSGSSRADSTISGTTDASHTATATEIFSISVDVSDVPVGTECVAVVRIYNGKLLMPRLYWTGE
jgi:hypothetical protein